MEWKNATTRNSNLSLIAQIDLATLSGFLIADKRWYLGHTTIIGFFPYQLIIALEEIK